MFRLDVDRSVLVLDEPDLHLHPGLIVRLVEMLEATGRLTSVLVATHSDRLLDALDEPARSVRVAELTAGLETRIRHLKPEALERWTEDYVGVGSIRANGHLGSIIAGREGSDEADPPL